MLLLALLSMPAHAQDTSARYLPPGTNVAAEDGATATWVNPANLGFDPDASLGMWYGQRLAADESEVRSFALATAAGNGSFGVFMNGGPDGSAWWGITSGVAFELPENVRLGVNGTLNLLGEGRGTFGTWDVGLGYRPLPFLGLGLVARNIAAEDVDLGLGGSYAAAVHLRPLGDRLEVGAEYEAHNGLGGDPLTQGGAGVMRVRPIDGLVLRGEVNQDLAWGAGMEVFYDGSGFGGFLGDSVGDITGYLVSGPPNERLAIETNRVPVFELSGAFAYQPVGGLLSTPGESYLHLLERMRESASDSSVKAVVLEIESPKFNFAQVQELRGVIQEIQDADKTVIAWVGGSVDNAGYLLATAADEIHLHPAGDLMVLGLAAQIRHLRGTLDLVGAEAQFARRSEYKSGPERFTRTDSSEPATEQISALLDDLHGELVAGIAASRDLDEAAVQAVIDRGPLTGAEAVEAGLIDGICYRDEVGKLLEKKQGKDEDDLETDSEYHLATDLSGWGSASKIAIVYVQGPITSGESSSGGILGGASTGSKTVVEALEAIAEDSSVKAVVMRVDSPGGSAYASDEIWKAVQEVQEEDKPVIVSMGGVAASGGYYVSAGADVIYAEPTTVTGSIGVYSGKLSFDDLYGKLGVSHEVHTRGRMGAMYLDSHRLDPLEFEAMDKMVGDVYRQFKEKVAQGRDLSDEAVEEVARGRVWSGKAAAENGLVDELGGFQDAIARARTEAGISKRADVTLVSFQGGGGLLGAMAPEVIRALLPDAAALPQALPGDEWLPYLRLADEPVLALLPWVLEVH